MTSTLPRPLARTLPTALFVVSIFFLNFLARIVLSPLMPVIEKDLGFTHAQAGELFMALGLGNALGLLLTGFISREITHRRTVGWSSIIMGCTTLAASLAWSHLSLLVAMFFIGIGAGLYLPSGIATITSLVCRKDWGKTMALHETAPNSAFVAAPLMAEAVLLAFGWRMNLILLGSVQLMLGVLFLKFGKGGNFPGVPTVSKVADSMLRRPLFWLYALCFGTAIGVAFGPYAMLPLYLVTDHGFLRETANQLVSSSRVLAVFVPFLAGYATDHWGAKIVMATFFALCGISTIALGIFSGPLLVAAVMVQPACSVLFFTAGFTAVSKSFNPEETTVAISFLGPINALVGVGIIPLILGTMGDLGLFRHGFIVLGTICLAVTLIIPLLPDER